MKNYIYNIIALVIVCTFLNSCSTWKLGKAGQKKIDGKTYVIVGASSGFGRGMAEELGKHKANVVLAARRTDLLEEIAAVIKASGGSPIVVTMDITKPEDLQRVLAESIKTFGKVDVWVNMVGVGAIGKFWEIPIEDQARVIDVNLKGFLYGSSTAVHQFQKQGYGTLINMGSIDSETPLAYQATYAATKAGVRTMGLALSQELQRNGYKNIKVATVEPWAVDTPWWGHAANYSGGTPRMAAMDSPDKVVNALLRISLRPRKELPVGWKAKGSWYMHHMAPRFTEWFSGKVAHKYQIVDAPPAKDTVGSIYQPMEAGRGVSDGVKDRIKKENRERKLNEKDKK